MYSKKIKLAILIIFISAVLWPLAMAKAADTSAVPAFNSLCWKKKECEDARKSFVVGDDKTKLEEGWVKEDPPCVGGEGDDTWGKCLPAGTAKTQISFGGENKFENVGVFILKIYNYAVGVASILAVVMIIIAGAQWIMSGGNSETITSAKKRIAGALVGLFIAYTSYFILNSINPALVNLRLPQVWLIKPQKLMPEFCTQAPSGTLFAAAGKGDEAAMKSAKFDINIDKNKSSLKCGDKFFMQTGGKATCMGDICKQGELCVDAGRENSLYQCQSGNIGGKITAGFTLSKRDVNIIGEIRLFVICKDGRSESASNLLTPGRPGGREGYLLTGEMEKCGGAENTVGFYLGAKITDCLWGSGLGGDCVIKTGSLDDWFALGRQPGSNVCNINLSKQLFRELARPESDCNKYPYFCSCAAIRGFVNGAKENAVQMANTKFHTYLISYQELKDSFRCDIAIDRNEFPALDNTTSLTLDDYIKAFTSGGVSWLTKFLLEANWGDSCG